MTGKIEREFGHDLETSRASSFDGCLETKHAPEVGANKPAEFTWGKSFPTWLLDVNLFFQQGESVEALDRLAIVVCTRASLGLRRLQRSNSLYANFVCVQELLMVNPVPTSHPRTSFCPSFRLAITLILSPFVIKICSLPTLTV